MLCIDPSEFPITFESSFVNGTISLNDDGSIFVDADSNREIEVEIPIYPINLSGVKGLYLGVNSTRSTFDLKVDDPVGGYYRAGVFDDAVVGDMNFYYLGPLSDDANIIAIKTSFHVNSGEENMKLMISSEPMEFKSAYKIEIPTRAVTLSQFKSWLDSRVPSVEIVSWADGTDEQIAAMVAAADAGQINLSDYWSAGDTRTVHLSAMAATGVGESHAAQNVQLVLTDPGHYTLANGKACSFVVLQKDSLSEYGYMNSSVTNSGGWNNCPRRTWCNSVYRNAIPASLRGIFKQFKVRTANGSGSGVTESTDWFSLFSEKEIFGSTTYANSSAESQNTQLNWYKTSSNRIKRMNGSAYGWWERSPCSGDSYSFCIVYTDGSANWHIANRSFGLAPFGCI